MHRGVNFATSHIQKHNSANNMENDRAQVDLGIAVDVEERLEEEAQRLPKRRFVGRRQAAEAAANGEANRDSNGTIQGMSLTNIFKYFANHEQYLSQEELLEL